jgi:NADH dehydrogenase FAD-containing subunit
MDYDKLVIAVGAVPNMLGLKDVDKHCLFLRDVHGSVLFFTLLFISLSLSLSISQFAIWFEKRSHTLTFY